MLEKMVEVTMMRGECNVFFLLEKVLPFYSNTRYILWVVYMHSYVMYNFWLGLSFE